MFTVLHRRPELLGGKARIFRAVERARNEFLKKTRPSAPKGSSSSIESGSYIDHLPLELVLNIFSHTSYLDAVRLRLVCRGFRSLIDAHESSLVGTLLNNYPDPSFAKLRRIFPPPRDRSSPNHRARRPTLRYHHILSQRHAVCWSLAFCLSSRAITPMFSPQLHFLAERKKRRDAELRRDDAVGIVQRRLTVQLYSVLHFLTYLNLRFSAAIAAHLAQDDPLPMTPSWLSPTYRDIQVELIRRLSNEELISTHHAMHFLVNSIRLAISPDAPHDKNDEIVSVMLRCHAPLARCVQFFAADVNSAPGKLRRQFMQDMESEKVAVAEETRTGRRKRAGSSASSGLGGDERDDWSPKIGQVWFEVARRELRSRGIEKHRNDSGVYFFPEASGELLVGCPDCE